MKSLRKNQSGIIYVFVTILVFLFLVGFIAFTAMAIMLPIGSAIGPVAISYHDSSWPLYNQLSFALTFMTNLWTYFLAVGFFILVLWVYSYSQHRGQPM